MRIQKLLVQGHVWQGETCVRNNSKHVLLGQIFHLHVPEPAPLTLVPELMNLSIVYEDALLLVLDKPPHLVVHPGPGHSTGTLVHGLLAHCGETLSSIGGVRRPGIVHRLDKGTSGLMVVAKNDKAHHFLSQQFTDKTLCRRYKAFVWGVPQPIDGTINRPLGRHPIHRQKQCVLQRGHHAVTHYRTVRTFFNGLLSQVECRLETGRTHQIRVHFQSIHHSLLGDSLYGKTPSRLPTSLKDFLQSWPAERTALHACSLSFIHPQTNAHCSFESTPPEDFLRLEHFLCQNGDSIERAPLFCHDKLD